MTNGKIPADIAKFYERNNLETPLSPEDEAAKKAEEEAERAQIVEQEHRAHEEGAQREREEVERIEEQGKRELEEQLEVFYKRYGLTGLKQPK